MGARAPLGEGGLVGLAAAVVLSAASFAATCRFPRVPVADGAEGPPFVLEPAAPSVTHVFRMTLDEERNAPRRLEHKSAGLFVELFSLAPPGPGVSRVTMTATGGAPVAATEVPEGGSGRIGVGFTPALECPALPCALAWEVTFTLLEGPAVTAVWGVAFEGAVVGVGQEPVLRVEVDGAEPVTGTEWSAATWSGAGLLGEWRTTSVAPGTPVENVLNLSVSGVPDVGGVSFGAVWLALQATSDEGTALEVTLETTGAEPTSVTTTLTPPAGGAVGWVTGGIGLRGLFADCDGGECFEEVLVSFALMKGDGAIVTWSATAFAEGRPGTEATPMVTLGLAP